MVFIWDYGPEFEIESNGPVQQIEQQQQQQDYLAQKSHLIPYPYNPVLTLHRSATVALIRTSGPHP